MELFTMLVNPAAVDAERTCEALRNAADAAGAGKATVQVRCVPMPEGTGIVCEIGDQDQGMAEELLTAMSRPIAAAMIEAYEHQLLDRCIHREIGADDPEGAEEVRIQLGDLFAAAGKQRKEGDLSYERRLAKLGGAIAEYLAAETFLHVEGFLRFRAEPYLEELRDAVSYAADEWMMERQYREFIALLKYFVYIQEAKIPAAHVVHHGNHDFTLLNERMLPIDTRQMDQFVVELIDKDISFEDVIVSTLISVSPGRLIVHTRTPEEQVIKTILTIFEGRTELCSNCTVCAPPLEKRGRK